MKLIERLKSDASWPEYRERIAARVLLDRETYNNIKSMVHFSLVEQLDITTVTDLPRDALAEYIRQALEKITIARNIPLNAKERADLISDLMNEILGLGPIEPLVHDESIQDILINGSDKVYVEKSGRLSLTPIQFRDNDHLMQIIDKIVSASGRRVDESSPMVDARMEDGSRVNVILPPLSLNGPVVSIRKFGANPITLRYVLDHLTMTDQMNHYLSAAVKSKLNILISGGTGAGKTTLLNVLSGYIPEMERIITIEDSAELRLNQPHVVSLESRPPNIESKGEVVLSDLVKNSLRMRPDRIIVGEVRGKEVIDMLQAMNTGHPGSMSTIHANSPKDALSRIEVMAGMGASFFSEYALRRLVSSAINIIVQISRLSDGRRRIVSVSEVLGMKGDVIEHKELFVFKQIGVDEGGNIFGDFMGGGGEPCFGDHLKSYGYVFDPAVFDFRLPVGYAE